MSYPVADIRERYMDLVAADETQFYRLLNEAESRLLETAKWNWCKVRADLTVTGGLIYLDQTEYVSLLGIVLDNGARVIRPQETEFTPHSGYVDEPGEASYGHIVDCGTVTVDLGSGDVRRKKYKVAGYVSDETVDCLLHIAHVPLTTPEDITLCPSARALKLAMQAVVYEEADDVERADAFWGKAYRSLNEQEKTQRGSVRASMEVRPFGDGIDSVHNVT